MTIYYSRPKLRSLCQGSRIAFIRQYRHMTQQVFGEKIGLSPKNARAQIARYEVHDRDITPDRLRKMAEVLDVNIKLIERWNFRDPEQLFYAMLWIDELCPNFVVRNTFRGYNQNETTNTLNEKYKEWRYMRKRYLGKYITYNKYLQWKLGKYEDSFKEAGK